ncbi:MAG TPA: hypothetical protein VII02_01930 [Gemmatimonadaceae bacterium]
MKKEQRQLERVTGRAENQLVRRGTASEHEAVVLLTSAGERMILQRIGGNPFDDAETRRLVGHEVEVEGYRVGDIFRFVKATPVDGRPG